MKRALFLLIGWVLLISLLSANADAVNVCKAPVDYQQISGPLAFADAGDAGGIGGLGGTGYSAGGEGGIGGTGRTGDPGNEGAGGIGGTGIVGTITGFASICVNGLEVHYDSDVPVSENGKASTARGLAIGQLVAVEAQASARGLEARQIEVIHALEGPVTRVDPATDQLEVMGAKVAVTHAAGQEQLATLKPGDWVQVSGHPAGADGIAASRIARIEARRDATISGRADETAPQLGGVTIDRRLHGELTVRGQWDGKRLTVRESLPSAGAEWQGRISQVVVETRVRQSSDQGIRTGRRDVDAALAANRDKNAAQKLSAELAAGTLIRVTARLSPEGKLQAVRIERASRQRLEQSNAAKPGSERKRDQEAGGDGRDNSGKDENRAAKEAAKAAERIEKQRSETERTERTEHADRERAEKAERQQRVERSDRVERSERVDRSGRDR